jgi:hypothetical protein
MPCAAAHWCSSSRNDCSNANVRFRPRRPVRYRHGRRVLGGAQRRERRWCWLDRWRVDSGLFDFHGEIGRRLLQALAVVALAGFGFERAQLPPSARGCSRSMLSSASASSVTTSKSRGPPRRTPPRGRVWRRRPRGGGVWRHEAIAALPELGSGHLRGVGPAPANRADPDADRRLFRNAFLEVVTGSRTGARDADDGTMAGLGRDVQRDGLASLVEVFDRDSFHEDYFGSPIRCKKPAFWWAVLASERVREIGSGGAEGSGAH